MLASILEILTHGNATQNRIVTSTNLNVDVARSYLRQLLSWGFVQVIDESKGRKKYSMTVKGREWLRAYKTLVTLEGYGH
ncbi:MAG: hypothetical protein JRN58_00795 [Nitrososphaerota archaeon]|nr:hypothetical protein [Nitrososphaerota archaeon]MDG6977601.1 hypothetical protein [Nitrososphaerota archaeon]